ncbi:hypothetical protein DFH08DRAFT_822815 [Mycena albidolilacea]|uniref:Uncharacterized protein n=1 Tax=Mycena albidolilacea TaxID=1033008 RepID=A0AAD7ECS0_9AGAR|nr:hypothetical protein DFH08DRAFT_822815 [Mycena albidolilacea]
MWMLRDSEHFSRTQVERILTKARSHALGEADLEVLRTAAPKLIDSVIRQTMQAPFCAGSTVFQKLQQRCSKLKAEFLSNDFHANFLMVVHAPNGVNPSPGKALVVGDPNVINTVEGIPNKRMGALVNHARCKLKGSPVFLNRVRPVRNSNGECLQLVLRWILDLILHADEFLKDVKRCSGGKVSSLKGFRNLGMK